MRGLLSEFAKEINAGDLFTIEYIKQKWEEIAGNIIATHSYPDRIYGNVLFIQADHPVFSNDIGMMKKILLNKIREMNLDFEIRDIKVEIKKFTTKRRG
ncbi:MAG: DUF721 domain-containing protein [Bacteroidales bacterium]